MKCPYCKKKMQGGYPEMIIHCKEDHQVDAVKLYREIFLKDHINYKESK